MGTVPTARPHCPLQKKIRVNLLREEVHIYCMKRVSVRMVNAKAQT